MRPKVAFAILSIALLAVAGLSYLRNQHSSPTEKNADPSPPATATTTAEQGQRAQDSKAESAKINASEASSASLGETKAAVTAAAVTSSNRLTSATNDSLSHEEYVEKRVGELMDLGMSDDPQALKTILSEVTNPESDIRKAAIEASKQFGSTNAIPALQEAIANTEFGEDKQDLREAIEFLKLPSFVAKRN